MVMHPWVSGLVHQFVRYEVGNLPSLPPLPHQPGGKEQEGLEEESEADPLVVLVLGHLLPIGHRTNSRMAIDVSVDRLYFSALGSTNQDTKALMLTIRLISLVNKEMRKRILLNIEVRLKKDDSRNPQFQMALHTALQKSKKPHSIAML